MLELEPDVVDEEGRPFCRSYSLHAQLGHGCSASVYSATEAEGERRFAVKLALRKPKLRWNLVVATFRNEARMLQSCAHPHIVGFHGLFEGSGAIALVLPLVETGDCQHLLQRHGCLAEVAVGAIIGQLCEALAHMHANGVIHRDVKLENILVRTTDRLPQIWLCDLGHACELSVVNARDRFFGTVNYAAPEVTAGPIWSFGADIWSLGACMYAMLANAPLRWIDGAPDLSPRTFLHVSTETKLLLKKILVAAPHKRVSLETISSALSSSMRPSDAPSAHGGMGLRRQPAGLSASGERSYSLLDLTTLDRSVKALPAGAPGLQPPSTNSISLASLVSHNSSDALTSLYDSASATGRLATNGTSGISPAAGPSGNTQALQRVLSRSVQIPAKMQFLWGERDRLLELGGLGIRAFNPSSGRVSHSWRYEDILAVVDERATKRSGLATTGNWWKSSQPGDDEAVKSHNLSILVDCPLLCGLAALKLTFSLQHDAEHRSVMTRIQAGIASAAQHNVSTEVDEACAAPIGSVTAEASGTLASQSDVSSVHHAKLVRKPSINTNGTTRDMSMYASPVSGHLGELSDSVIENRVGEPAIVVPRQSLPPPPPPPREDPPMATGNARFGARMPSKRVSASCGSLDTLCASSEPALSTAQQEMLARMRESMAALQKVRAIS